MFSGDGPSKGMLEKMSLEAGVRNVTFTGRYKKTEEEIIVRQCDVINNFTNRDINSDSLLSNRFYLSATLRKPMIVRDGTYQAEIAKKFGLACIIKENDNIVEKISCYKRNFDIFRYNQSCETFLAYVKEDIKSFETNITNLYNNCKI